jgi:hypothetical protein
MPEKRYKQLALLLMPLMFAVLMGYLHVPYENYVSVVDCSDYLDFHRFLPLIFIVTLIAVAIPAGIAMFSRRGWFVCLLFLSTSISVFGLRPCTAPTYG